MTDNTQKHDTSSKSIVERCAIKPGDGWKDFGGGIYEKSKGVRILISGHCRLPDGTFISGNQEPFYRDMNKFILMNGGNRKRGVMAWANNLAL